MTNGFLTLAELRATHTGTGHLNWIGLRPNRDTPMRAAEAVEAVAGRGLAGDRHAARAHSGANARQVTLIQQEHLAVIAALAHGTRIEPASLRRNLLVSGINLLALQRAQFRIGDVTLQGTGLCHPCSRMEASLGTGGYNAMRGHGGITARIIEGGWLRVGDVVCALPGEPGK